MTSMARTTASGLMMYAIWMPTSSRELWLPPQGRWLLDPGDLYAANFTSVKGHWTGVCATGAAFIGDEVLISSSQEHCVIRYDMQGTEIARFGSQGSNIDQFSSPRIITVSGDEVFIQDGLRLSIWSVSGQPLRMLDVGTLVHGGGVWYHAIGQTRLFIIEESSGVRVLDKQSGALLCTVDANFDTLSDIAVCGQTVLVLDFRWGVRAFDLRGNPVGSTVSTLGRGYNSKMCVRDCGDHAEVTMSSIAGLCQYDMSW